jgi:uncharacterized protein YqeY
VSTDLRTRLQSALLPAMRAGDRDTVAVVRSALAALANAEALTPEEVRAVVERERQDRIRAAEDSEAGGLGEYAARLRSQAAVLAFLLETSP